MLTSDLLRARDTRSCNRATADVERKGSIGHTPRSSWIVGSEMSMNVAVCISAWFDIGASLLGTVLHMHEHETVVHDNVRSLSEEIGKEL